MCFIANKDNMSLVTEKERACTVAKVSINTLDEYEYYFDKITSLSKHGRPRSRSFDRRGAMFLIGSYDLGDDHTSTIDRAATLPLQKMEHSDEAPVRPIILTNPKDSFTARRRPSQSQRNNIHKDNSFPNMIESQDRGESFINQKRKDFLNQRHVETDSDLQKNDNDQFKKKFKEQFLMNGSRRNLFQSNSALSCSSRSVRSAPTTFRTNPAFINQMRQEFQSQRQMGNHSKSCRRGALSSSSTGIN